MLFGNYDWRANYYGVNDCVAAVNPDCGAQQAGGGRPTCAWYIINSGWKIPDDYPYFK